MLLVIDIVVQDVNVQVDEGVSVKLEPGVVQPPPAFAKPLKLEIQDTYVDSGMSITSTPKSHRRLASILLQRAL